MGKKVKTVIVAGPPGSGKSTVISRMYSESVKKISTGDILRNEIESGSRTGKKIKSIMDRGKLAPSKLVKTLISKYIDDNLDRKTEMFMFDGFPRDVEEISQFFEIINRKVFSFNAVIILKLTENQLISRVQKRRICPNCGAIYNIEKSPPSFTDARLEKRKDDDLETLKKQIEEFKEKTMPVIDYFKREYESIVLELDSGPPINQIMYEIFIGLKEKGIMLF